MDEQQEAEEDEGGWRESALVNLRCLHEGERRETDVMADWWSLATES